jgi:hypothetical protein
VPQCVAGFRRDLSGALRGATAQIAAELRTPLVNRAEELPGAIRSGSQIKGRAVAVAHAHERTMAGELCDLRRLFAESSPVRSRHPHKNRRPRETARPALLALGRGRRGRDRQLIVSR